MNNVEKQAGASSANRPNYYLVQFKRDRVDYFIDRNHLPLRKKAWVVVQAERGRDIGRIKLHIPEEHMVQSQHKYPLEILHEAKPEELELLTQNRSRENEIFKTGKELIEFRGLDMKLVDVEIQFDGNKITFYFTAELRVDFRELVKDLAATYRTRIELRQIGVRDETKKIGGLGPCGLELCCASWLREFKPISTQYARDQNLAVNPNKLSGPCGRLFCCLDYEQEFYEGARSDFPQEQQVFTDGDEKYIVVKLNFFTNEILLKKTDSDGIIPISLDDFRCKFCKKNNEWLEKWLPKSEQ